MFSLISIVDVCFHVLYGSFDFHDLEGVWFL
jgi:hypothetical protein